MCHSLAADTRGGYPRTEPVSRLEEPPCARAHFSVFFFPLLCSLRLPARPSPPSAPATTRAPRRSTPAPRRAAGGSAWLRPLRRAVRTSTVCPGTCAGLGARPASPAPRRSGRSGPGRPGWAAGRNPAPPGCAARPDRRDRRARPGRRGAPGPAGPQGEPGRGLASFDELGGLPLHGRRAHRHGHDPVRVGQRGHHRLLRVQRAWADVDDPGQRGHDRPDGGRGERVRGSREHRLRARGRRRVPRRLPLGRGHQRHAAGRRARGDVIAPGGHYLLGGAPTPVPVAPDQSFGIGLAATAGGVGVRNPDGTLLDSVGWGPPSPTASSRANPRRPHPRPRAPDRASAGCPTAPTRTTTPSTSPSARHPTHACAHGELRVSRGR